MLLGEFTGFRDLGQGSHQGGRGERAFIERRKRKRRKRKRRKRKRRKRKRRRKRTKCLNYIGKSLWGEGQPSLCQ